MCALECTNKIIIPERGKCLKVLMDLKEWIVSKCNVHGTEDTVDGSDGVNDSESNKIRVGYYSLQHSSCIG